MTRMAFLLMLALTLLHAQNFTRGLGVYPGDPAEDFSPALVPGPAQVRNLALQRSALQSSSYDYNLTAQLVTDGITATAMPRWLVVSTSQQGVLPRHQREWISDGNWVTELPLQGRSAWIQLEFPGAPAPSASRIAVDATIAGPRPENQMWAITAKALEPDGAWKPVGTTDGFARPSGEIHASLELNADLAGIRTLRLEFETGRPAQWRVGELAFFDGATPVQIAGPHHFTSAWKPLGSGEEWVSVDLGAESAVECAVLHWLKAPPRALLQVSADGNAWRDLGPVTSGELPLSPPVRGRYFRVLLPAAGDAILSEVQLFGVGGLVPQPRKAALGGVWRLARAPQVAATGAVLSRPGYADGAWLPATVPGTILASYYNAGALPDPNFSDNQLAISDAFFQEDFWYRTEFSATPAAPRRKQWLHFDGINWKADVWLNGQRLGRIEGAFERARFDVTGKLRSGQPNALAVRVHKVATPGSAKEKTFENPDKNGGALGADNPTFHASIGWDWIPTIRGRNTGIWNAVRLSETGAVTVEDPCIRSQLQANSAQVTIAAVVRNHTATAWSGVLRGAFGNLPFERSVQLKPRETSTVEVSLTVVNPKLWWPAGYGEPSLYPLTLRLGDSHEIRVQAGIREWRYSTEGGNLRFWINGRRFIPKGGNWGFSESMLRYRAREYDAAMRYHADMHFNMVRNWVGQIGEDAFYEAADRHGIVVMQDFWLANPWDGPNPDDNQMFLRNARDTVLRVRHHASIGLYCGRNEGFPPKPLEDGFRALRNELHPEIFYTPSSADDLVSGHGPYRRMPLKHYFEQRATPQFHSEMGMPNILSMESLQATMKPGEFWPQGAAWGLHDFCLTGAQGGASFREEIEQAYGGANSVEEWIALAQFVNYEGYRAMFEAQSKNRMGLLIWMSHPTWPSFVWQTYDYFLEPTAGYFAAKKACEPLHVQWNPLNDAVEVVNYSAGAQQGLRVTAEVLNPDGAVVWRNDATLDSAEDSVQSPFRAVFPSAVADIHFLRLKLSRGAELLSENTYWRGKREGDFTGLRKLPEAQILVQAEGASQAGVFRYRVRLTNTAKTVAPMVRVMPVRRESRDRILPALFSDNYLTLMPGEAREITVEFQEADTRGETPAFVVQSYHGRGAN